MQTKINAVELVRQIRDAHYESVKNKTHEERLAFYQAKAQELHRKVESTLHAHEESVTSEQR